MLLNVASVIATVLVGGGPYQGWLGHGGNAQHTGLSGVPASTFGRIAWSTPIDLTPRYFGTSLLTHYGSPCITFSNTAIVPVKQNLDSGFNVNAFRGSDGALVWSATTDYIMPPHNWTPSFGPCIVPPSRENPRQMVAWPMAGGRIAFRAADAPAAPITTVAFYGNAVYNANPSQYNNNVRISTPLNCAPDGTVYFGFVVLGANGAGLQSGLARVNINGTGTWLSAATASNDPAINAVKPNCTPAISEKGEFVYVTLSSGNFAKGCLVKVATKGILKTLARVVLMDPKANVPAAVDNDGTASPMIAPDGDVYVGVLESSLGSNHFRGWLLHFNGDLTQTKIPGAFGWDDTVSVVPASMVPSYSGSSSYLLVSKYNNYAGAGGNGQNKIALLDPMVSATEAVSGISTMKEIATVVGPTPDADFPSNPLAVREWCVNTCAVDVAGKCIIVNCEDGVLYKWDMNTFTLSENIRLTAGIGEAYTPTAIGPDGGIYAISNARLYVIGSASH